MNRIYFTDGKYLYYKTFREDDFGKTRVRYNEVQKIDGIYAPKYQDILRRLLEKREKQIEQIEDDKEEVLVTF